MSKDLDAVLEVLKGIMDAAGCASLITVDEAGFPSSRPVRTFPSDDKRNGPRIFGQGLSHTALNRRTPDAVYFGETTMPTAA